jgi:hypothetical protein
MMPIVDVSDTSMAASGTTKRISINNILACSPTATLASATITGDLTVRTNAISATSTGVGFGITTAAAAIDVVSSFQWRSNTAGTDKLAMFSGGTGLIYLGSTTASALGFLYNGSTAMTLDSTGLGVGVASPSFNIHARGTTDGRIQVEGASGYGMVFIQASSGNTAQLQLNSNGGSGRRYVVASNTSGQFLIGDETAVQTRLLIDSSGNVGISVAPSAWGGGGRAFEIGFIGTGIQSRNNQYSAFTQNSWFNSSAQWIYGATGLASRYDQDAGTHKWFIAPSGTAGNAITFTQAMTLAANGQLLLGTSSTSGAIDIGMVMNKPSATGFVGNVYQLNSVDKAYTYIASATAALRIDTVAGYTVNVISGGTNGVYLANGGVAWLALSDERFKDIIEPISNAVAKVGSLRSVIGKFKTDSEGTRRPFLFAQDVQAVLPEAVDATKPEQLGLSYTEVIPLLVAAIQELTAEVNALKNA